MEISLKDQKELREMYKKRLKRAPQRSKGAGLGFIDMARRVKKFEYELHESENGPLFV